MLSAFGVDDGRVGKSAPAEVHVDRPLNAPDRSRNRRLVRIAAIGSGGAALGAGASKLHRNKVNPKVVLGGAAVGSGLTAVRAHRDAKRDRDQRS